MTSNSDLIWLNGQISQTPLVSALSAGLTLGWGVFTTVGIEGGAPQFFARHLERLQRDARRAEIPFDWSFEAGRIGLNAVLRQNRVENGLARLTLSQRGDGRWSEAEGADFSIAAHESEPLPLIGVRLAVSPFRVEAKRPLAGVKTTSYLPFFWAWRDAKTAGFDDALLLTSEGHVCESARANVFWLRDRELWTPSLETGCLDGLGRALVLEAAREMGWIAREGDIQGKNWREPGEVWLVSASSGVRSVSQIGEWKLGGPGEQWRAMRAWWEEKKKSAAW